MIELTTGPEEQAALRHLKSQISNGETEIWHLRSEIPSAARTGAATKPVAHCIALEAVPLDRGVTSNCGIRVDPAAHVRRTSRDAPVTCPRFADRMELAPGLAFILQGHSFRPLRSASVFCCSRLGHVQAHSSFVEDNALRF